MKICPKCGKEYENTTTLCPADGAALQKPPDELIGQTLIDKYRIEERLDEGGMGTVYRATHVLMEKTVAIKVLHPSLAADDKIVQRFTREARAASRISHPHALSVTDFGEAENGIVFLVMEYLRGRTLKEIIKSEGPMPLERVVKIIRQVCGALEAAHAEGVVHRDLKSDNIMLEEVGGGDDWAKVLDFGIAKIQEDANSKDPGLTAPNLIIGTPQYMSPEQCAQASEIDSRSDIYSLGVILYEMLVGHVPFSGASPTAIMLKHIQEPAPSVLEERKDVPPAIGRVVSRAMSKRPEDRYQSASELTEAFTLAASGEEPEQTTENVGAKTTPVAPVPLERAAVGDTNRIVVPTDPNLPPHDTSNEEHDEATVVSARKPTTGYSVPAVLATGEQPSAAGFNPRRIIIPAVALLVVVFGAFYAFQNSSTGTPTEEQPLVVDPGGVPVQAASPATGESERDLQPGSTTPSASPQIGADGQPVTPSPNAGGGEPTPTPPAGTNEGNQQGRPPNNEEPQQEEVPEEEEEPEPTPTPANRNTNRRIPPRLRDTPSDDEPPPVPRNTPASPPSEDQLSSSDSRR